MKTDPGAVNRRRSSRKVQRPMIRCLCCRLLAAFLLAIKKRFGFASEYHVGRTEGRSHMNTPKALPLNSAYAFALEKGLEQETTEIRRMVIDGVNDVLRVRRGWIIKMLEDHALFDAFKDQYWPFGKTPEG